MRNIKLVVEYDGSRYDGWQKQPKRKTSITVQDKIEEVLKKMTEEDIDLVGAARTEAGVHAYAQICNFITKSDMKLFEIKHYLNRYLPRDIAILEVMEVTERFNSSLNLKGIKYQYRIGIGEVASVFDRKYTYYSFDELDVTKMKEALKYLIGKHDFKAFSDNKRMKKSTEREVLEADIYADIKEISITITVDDSWPKMIRIIVGTLIDIGRGKIAPEKIKQIIESKDREMACETAEAKGLFLQDIIY